MGLKDLKSNLDLLGGFGNEGETLGGMENFNPNNFQRSTTDASQAHINSLQQVPGGDSNSPYQDLDGELGPQFQRDTTIASQVHISSLGLVPGGDSSSPFQDRSNGATPTQYLDNLPN